MPGSDRSDAVGGRAGAPTRGPLLLPLLAVAGLFVVLMIAAALQGTPSIRPPAVEQPDRLPSAEPIPEQTGAVLPDVGQHGEPLVQRIIAVVLAIVIGASILMLLVLGIRTLVRALAGLWRDRPLARREAAEVDPGRTTAAAVAPAPDSRTIQRGIATALRSIESGADPADSIVAAWVGLEESAADAGVHRGSAETAGEFTARILGHRPGAAAAIVELLGLYEGVRFGGRVADEADRQAASRCLRSIEEEWR